MASLAWESTDVKSVGDGVADSGSRLPKNGLHSAQAHETSEPRTEWAVYLVPSRAQA